MAWHDVVLAFDTETTGLTGDAEIIEIGVVHYYKGQRVREWSSFFCPRLARRDDPNVMKALEVNQINWDDLMTKAPTFRKMVDDIEKELSEAVWVAHNAEFDVRMLRQEFQRLERSMVFQPDIVLCTKTLDCALSPNQQSYSLAPVTTRWGVTQDGAHRAIVDARACGDVLVKMVESGRLPADLGQAKEFVKTAEQGWHRRPKPSRQAR